MVRLIVSDIDGCLTRGGSDPLPLEFFISLQAWNHRARRDDALPPITLCTGRPQPYVEAIIQATGCFMPVLCESGGVLYDLTDRSMLLSPGFTETRRALYDQLYREVMTHYINNGRPIVIEPGKNTEITLVPHPPLTVDAIWDESIAFIEPYADDFKISRTKSVVNFSFHDIDKEHGVHWLAAHTGISCNHMAGFGDTQPDIGFLKQMGIAGCPSNAMQEVKDVCGFVSGREFHEGFQEFITHLGYEFP